ncbi:hypothetical protein [Cryobacterium psychrophilum]|uniref:Uncharacterized protein n=1 Tax=Cryobacterium psychrophilum TaxID=41988 RepID=A0A4Y8KTN4_9MICO|nr:hypothetical protein [Cryobacterium psychrophilum]TDW28888.1 hypothetical protein EDD25_0551 [Cryobacterium psychrophilum]TFD81083.1 hypothetical protein E3T53_03655 [Cryobacterium psychrophilum]
MKIELLHIADCPNWEESLHRLQLAVDIVVTASPTIDARLIDSTEEAESLPFAGSPTILVDGVDLFPSEGRTNDLAWRIYFTPNGMAGSPTQQQIEEALTAHG